MGTRSFAVSYFYDSLNRLTNVNYGNGSIISYTYDAAGNRLTYSGTVASAGTNFVVSNNLDSGPGSLRQLIESANNAGGGTITFSNVTGTITLTGGELLINTNIDIIGPGSAILSVSGGATSRVFDVSSNASASISGLAIQDGSVAGWGGGVYNLGNLALNDCVVANNSAIYTNTIGSILGGGIYNAGTLTLTNCLVTNNWVGVSPFNGNPGGTTGLGGGIFNQGNLTVYQSVISSNWCAAITAMASITGGSGGGIYNVSSATIILSTISNNRSGDGNESNGDTPPGSGGSGGGIYNTGELLVDATTIVGNACGTGGSGVPWGYDGAVGGSGGAIWNAGQLIMNNCTVSTNSSGAGGDGATSITAGTGGPGGDGGALYSSGTANVTNCAFIGNSSGTGGSGQPYTADGYDITSATGGSGGNGAAIFNQGAFAICNCTLYGNIAGSGGRGSDSTSSSFAGGNGGNGGNGGAILEEAASFTLSSCTISSNSVGVGGAGGAGYPSPSSPAGSPGSDGTGSGVDVGGGTLQTVNSLIANNFAGAVGSDVAGTFVSLGYNLIGNTDGSYGFGATGDLIGVNPLLGPLADNGGPTPTCALLPGSPAIDAGTSVGAPSTDQRGVARPQGSAVDIGAFELVFIIPPQLTGLNISNRFFQFELVGAVGSNYVIQASSNLVIWVNVATNVLPASGVDFSFLITPNQPQMFYRAMPWAAESQIYIPAASGEITAPFILTNGYIYQPIQTTVVTNAGRAAYNVNIAQAGTYVIQTTVNAPSDSENSFFVNIDAEPQSPTMIWDIYPLTSGFEQRTVSWRGTGSVTNNEYIPKVFNLTAGLHQIIIRGREKNTELRDMTIVPYP